MQNLGGGGQTKCIMGNSKLPNGFIAHTQLKTYCGLWSQCKHGCARLNLKALTVAKMKILFTLPLLVQTFK